MRYFVALFIMFSLTNLTSASEQLHQVKKEILELASSFEGQVDHEGELQEALEEKIDILLTLIPHLTMAEKAKRAVGAWRQVWGPYSYDGSNSIPRGMLVNQIFQVIDAKGHYYNFADYKWLGLRTRIFLRGNFSVEEDRIEVVFNKSGIVLGNRNAPRSQLARDLESGIARAIRFPDRFPPIGVTGALIEVYADKDIRINYGINGDETRPPTLFIMEPAQ